MKTIIFKSYKFLLKRSKTFLFFFLLITLYIFPIPILYISHLIQGKKSMTELPVTGLSDAFIAIIIIPVVETLIFQTLIFYICKEKLKIRNFLLIVFLSAFAFGIYHFYDLTYILYGFTSGVVFALGYGIFRRINFHPILIVSLAHAIVNGIAVLARYLEYNV